MLKLTRATEYGLMALQYMNQKGVSDHSEAISAREIADFYGLKLLQRSFKS